MPSITEVVLHKQKAKLVPPPFYRVIMHNDDYTTTDFVVQVLQKFFHYNLEQAEVLMLQVHTQGHAVCGVYPRDIAMTRVSLVVDYARQHQYPLQCTCEPVD